MRRIEWFSDKNLLSIYFSEMPITGELYQSPKMTDKEKDDIAKKPLICRNSVKVTLFDHVKMKKYEFEIEKNYRWNGASIPWGLWNLIGSPSESRFLIPSMLHDKMCENHELVGYDRYFADKVFERCLYVSGVCAFKRWLMFHSVDNYQKFCGWRAKK